MKEILSSTTSMSSLSYVPGLTPTASAAIVEATCSSSTFKSSHRSSSSIDNTVPGWFRSVDRTVLPTISSNTILDHNHPLENDSSCSPCSTRVKNYQSTSTLLSMRGGSIEQTSDTEEKATKKKTTTKKSTKSSSTKIIDEILKEDDYYKILGFSNKSSSTSTGKIVEKDIQKAYRKRAVQTHPDKTNGDRRAFDKVAEAYDVLSNKNKRTIYDRYGKKGLDNSTSNGGAGASGFSTSSSFAGGSPEDIFRSFFFSDSAGGGNNPFRQAQQQQQQANRTVRYQIEVSLEDMYNGVSKRVQLPKQTYNPFSRRQQPNNPNDDKEVEIDIPKGSYDGQTIVLSGANDSNVNETPGDIIFIIKQRQHNMYTRKGYDLAIEVSISLAEALTGFTSSIQHINGKTITISSAKTSSTIRTTMIEDNNNEQQSIPIQTGDVQVLKSYGMPKDTRGMSYGDLYIQFKVQMPKINATTRNKSSSLLTNDEQKELRRLLNKLEGKVSSTSTSTSTSTPQSNNDSYLNNNNNNKNNKNVLFLQPASVSDFGRNKPSSSNEYNDNNNNNFFGDNSQQQQQSFYFSSSNGMNSGTNNFGGGNTDPFGFFGASAATGEDETQCRQM